MRVQLPQNPIARMFSIIVAFYCLFFAWWFLGGKSVVERLGNRMTEPWADFEVPDNAVHLEGLQVTSAARILTVCNKGKEDWNNVLIQIDKGYVAALDKLRIGECKQIPIETFATASWKRLPAPPGLEVTKVEVLATVARKGYAWSPPHNLPAGAKK